MKQLFLTFVILIFSISSFTSDSKTSRMNLNSDAKKEVLDIFKVNEELHQAFYENNAEKVEKKAQELQKEIGEINNEEIKKLLTFSQKKLAEIKASKNKEENDQTYHLVSMALIHIMSKYDIGDEYNAYSCPMVKKKWIQNSKKISKVHNPYMLDMPNCGSQDSHH